MLLKYKYNIVIFAILLLMRIVMPCENVFANTHIAGNQISASVGDFYLSLSGIISPFASVILTSDNMYLRSTVADKDGKFFLDLVNIKKGFSQFCLDAIDFKRIGESYTCFSIPPATDSVTINNIFLPPTLGLFRIQITQGGEAYAFGYSMPGAVVTIHFIRGKSYTTTASSTGYYEFHIPITAAGKFELYADAAYQNQTSKKPDRTVTLESLSPVSQLLQQTKQKIQQIPKAIKQSSFNWLWVAIPILISIIILSKKLFPRWFRWIDFLLPAALHKQKKKLHHAWFVGY